MPKGKCPGDHDCPDGVRSVQPQPVPAKKSTFDVATMWKTTVPVTNVKQNSAAIADKKEQMDKLKGEY